MSAPYNTGHMVSLGAARPRRALHTAKNGQCSLDMFKVVESHLLHGMASKLQPMALDMVRIKGLDLVSWPVCLKKSKK